MDSVRFCAAAMRCHGDSVTPDSVPLRNVPWVSFRFYVVLRMGNYSTDLVAIKAPCILTVVTFFSFLLYATSCILERLSRIQKLPSSSCPCLLSLNPITLAQLRTP